MSAPTPAFSKKLLWASVALAALLGLSSATHLSAATAARALLGLAALGAIGFWVLRQRTLRAQATFELGPRLAVVSRHALAGRTQVALVEADGQRFLVTHGEGFATVVPVEVVAPKPPPLRKSKAVTAPIAQARTPRRAPRPRRLS